MGKKKMMIHHRASPIVKWIFTLLFTILLFVGFIYSSHSQAQYVGNKPERLEWFRDMGFGLFIHWSVDSQLGSVISHSMVGASEDYLQRYIKDLPRTFNPHSFQPKEWAVLAKLAGFQYVVFTAKHHNGFCMFDTATTDFDIMNTPYHRDITRELFDAFREQGIAIGIYFSPDDFWFLHQQGKLIARARPGLVPQENPPLMEYAQKQLRELLTNYGPIDVMFIDGMEGRAEGLKELCWELQPDIVVTRGAMKTPEQEILDRSLDEPWEACFTMGTQWAYKPTHEEYKSGTRCIEMLIETRAKGGNLLLNIGPKPDGALPIEQEERLREVALWMFVNQEAIYSVRPWSNLREGDIWFTKKKDEDTVYAFVTHRKLELGDKVDIMLKSLRINGDSVISVLGQNDKVLEYQPTVDPKTLWRQDDEGLHITFTQSQRLYNDRKWPNPVVLKITHAQAKN